MAQEIIKRCPFCGSRPNYGGYPDVRIECEKCKQAMVKAAWYGGDLGTMEESWNRRAADPLTAELLEALEEYTKAAQRAYDALKTGWNVHGVAATLERANIKAHAVIQKAKGAAS